MVSFNNIGNTGGIGKPDKSDFKPAVKLDQPKDLQQGNNVAGTTFTNLNSTNAINPALRGKPKTEVSTEIKFDGTAPSKTGSSTGVDMMASVAKGFGENPQKAIEDAAVKDQTNQIFNGMISIA